MALNDVEPGKLCGGGLSKTRFAAETIAKRRIHRQRLPASGVFPLASDERDIQLGVLRQHVERARHKTLCAAVGIVSLSNDCQLHGRVSRSIVSIALKTCCGVIAVMQSETPPSPQPALPQGWQVNPAVITR